VQLDAIREIYYLSRIFGMVNDTLVIDRVKVEIMQRLKLKIKKKAEVYKVVYSDRPVSRIYGCRKTKLDRCNK